MFIDSQIVCVESFCLSSFLLCCVVGDQVAETSLRNLHGDLYSQLYDNDLFMHYIVYSVVLDSHIVFHLRTFLTPAKNQQKCIYYHIFYSFFGQMFFSKNFVLKHT